MAYAQLDGIRLYYESAGTGRPVVLVNSMGTTPEAPAETAAAIRDVVRVSTGNTGKRTRP